MPPVIRLRRFLQVSARGEYSLESHSLACRWSFGKKMKALRPGEVTCAGRAASQSSTTQVYQRCRDGPEHKRRASMCSPRCGMCRRPVSNAGGCEGQHASR